MTGENFSVAELIRRLEHAEIAPETTPETKEVLRYLKSLDDELRLTLRIKQSIQDERDAFRRVLQNARDMPTLKGLKPEQMANLVHDMIRDCLEPTLTPEQVKERTEAVIEKARVLSFKNLSPGGPMGPKFPADHVISEVSKFNQDTDAHPGKRIHDEVEKFNQDNSDDIRAGVDIEYFEGTDDILCVTFELEATLGDVVYEMATPPRPKVKPEEVRTILNQGFMAASAAQDPTAHPDSYIVPWHVTSVCNNLWSPEDDPSLWELVGREVVKFNHDNPDGFDVASYVIEQGGVVVLNLKVDVEGTTYSLESGRFPEANYKIIRETLNNGVEHAHRFHDPELAHKCYEISWFVKDICTEEEGTCGC